ncbi:hypothetical protein [Caballeronia sp. DA-9]|uniref:hypothetical protein n=1 Tax=Caballeronia sp. DA-9 TaxID=3436237 RepID=UPI003F67D0B0
MSRNWTKEEVETMRDIVMSGKSLKKNMNLLPGRSYHGASTKCVEVGIRVPKVGERILILMSDGAPRTARAIADALNLPRKSVSDALRNAVWPDDGQSMHICARTAESKEFLYVIGEGLNVNLSPAEAERRRIAKREREADKRYESRTTWWPRADPVVISAINAMVHAGRAA